jgi:hypothetical protein
VYAEESTRVDVMNPAFDYVSPDLVTLFVTNEYADLLLTRALARARAPARTVVPGTSSHMHTHTHTHTHDARVYACAS